MMMIRIYFNILFFLISFSGYSQPGCSESYSVSFLNVTYHSTPSVNPMLEGEFVSYDTLFANQETNINGLYYIIIASEDTVSVKIETDRGNVELRLLYGQILRNSPTCFLIKGLPKDSGVYYIDLNRKNWVNFYMTCCYDITPEKWEEIKSIK